MFVNCPLFPPLSLNSLPICSPSRNKHQHSNPYAREANAGGQRGWQQPEGRPAGYDDALEKVPWGGWQEGSWRGRDSIPMGLLSPRPESPKWLQHELSKWRA